MSIEGEQVTVIKQNEKGEEVWRYSGRLLERGMDYATIEAFFDRDDDDIYGLFLRRGDRFIETFYNNRWYNIHEVHAREDDRLRGWYCNICKPAQIDEKRISYEDLAIDLLVYTNGRQRVVDMDEFDKLDISSNDREKALQALTELQALFQGKIS